MAQPTENFTSKENIREVDRVQEQVKQELASIKKTLFYETSEDGQVQYHLDVVKQYLETKKDKPWNELVSENRSTQIMAIQIALESMGYDVGRIDGIFGPLTKAKVAEFQKANELKVDGLPGAETIGKIGQKLEASNLSDEKKNEDKKTTTEIGTKTNKVDDFGNTIYTIKSLNDLPKNYKREESLKRVYYYTDDKYVYKFYANGRVSNGETIQNSADLIVSLKSNNKDKNKDIEDEKKGKKKINGSKAENTEASLPINGDIYKGRLSTIKEYIKQYPTIKNSSIKEGIQERDISQNDTNNPYVNVYYGKSRGGSIRPFIKVDTTQCEDKEGNFQTELLVSLVEKEIDKRNKAYEEKKAENEKEKAEQQKIYTFLTQIRDSSYTLKDLYKEDNKKINNEKYLLFANNFKGSEIHIDSNMNYTKLSPDKTILLFDLDRIGKIDPKIYKNKGIELAVLKNGDGEYSLDKFKKELGKIVDKIIEETYS